MTLANLSIGWRLALSFGLVLMLMVFVTAFGIRKVQFIDSTLTTMTDVNSVKQRQAINFRGSVHDRAIALRDVVLFDSPAGVRESLAEIDRLAAFYSEAAQELDSILANPDKATVQDKQILRDIQAIERRTLPLIEEVIRLRQSGATEEAKALLMTSARPAFTDWLAAINRFIDEQESKNRTATMAAREVAGEFTLVMVILCAVAIVIGCIVAWLITHQLLRSLGGEPADVAARVTRIAEGDLTDSLPSSHASSMLAAVSTMQGTLRHLFADIRGIARDLDRRATALGQASLETQQAAEAQAAASDASAASIQQMTHSISAASQSARQTERNSEQTVRLADQGQNLVQNAAVEMERISGSVSETAQRIQALQQRSQEIGGIVDVIQDIAEQTNLLALNAAIEAARAGESGRGFAVVADEVRNLAGRTRDATTEITRMISVIRQETQDNVDAMEAAVPQVQRGLDLAREAASMLEEIRRQAEDSFQQVRQVAQAAGEQSEAATELSRHVDEIASMSASTTRAMKENTASIGELAMIARKLSEEMAQFRLP